MNHFLTKPKEYFIIQCWIDGEWKEGEEISTVEIAWEVAKELAGKIGWNYVKVYRVIVKVVEEIPF